MDFVKAFPILIIIAACLIFLTIKRFRLTKKLNESKEDYFKREHDANFARKQDISELPYIEVPSSIRAYDSTIDAIASSEDGILNLSGQSNTDLKLAYGVPNLEILTRCDDNYAALIKRLNEVGNNFIEIGLVDDAVTVLEYAVEIGSDISTTYEMLAGIYQTNGNNDKLEALREKANALDSIQKDLIIRKLS